MAAKQIEFHPAARAELMSAVEWYVQRSEPAAANFATEIHHALAQITALPETWPKGVHGTRKFVLRRFPYAIVYRQQKTHIEVLAVAHGRRRPDYWKKRL